MIAATALLTKAQTLALDSARGLKLILGRKKIILASFEYAESN